MKKLIIGEKPNYAKTCVKAIEKMESIKPFPKYELKFSGKKKRRS